jgi:hypothetical protein
VIDLKHIKIGVITLLLFGLVIALTGMVCADLGVNATPEIQSLGTTTTADVVGLVMETDAGVWTLTNDPSKFHQISAAGGFINVHLTQDEFSQLTAAGGSYNVNGVGTITQLTVPDSLMNVQIVGGSLTWGEFLALVVSSYPFAIVKDIDSGIHTGALDPGQIQYTTAYDANIVAQGGHTSFVKQMDLHTGNKVISQSNLNAQTGLTFAATSDGGNVVGSENLMLDGAGMNTTASDKLLCPFAAGIANAIPAYCNIVQAGSKFDLTIGSVTTKADDAFVHSDATIPVVLNYYINVKPYGTSQGQIPAGGSTSAYIRAHIQEARGNGTAKAEDLTYSETSSASGRITAFNKVMSYSSQVTSSAAGNHVIHASVRAIGSFTANGHVTAFISPSGDVQVPDHNSITFTMGTTGFTSSQSITPSIDSAVVTVDGVNIGQQSSYTFQDVTSDHTIVVSPVH